MSGRTTSTVLVAALLAGACGGRDDRAALTDSTLSRDLTTAAQVNGMAATDTVATIERTGTAVRPATRRPAGSGTTRPATSSGTASSTTSSGTTSSGGTSGTATAPRSVVVKHTARDAAIGAAAGALIGATTSRDRVKGGLIGGAAGAILGGVIGNNVDKKRTTVP